VLAAAFRIPVPGGTIALAVEGHPAAISEKALSEWVGESGRAVAAYYRRFPVPAVELTVRTRGGDEISGGRTRATRAGAMIALSVGEQTTPAELAANWVMVHEMVHLAFPETGREWIEEGLATYVEPLVRARAGLIAGDEIWRWLLWGLPRGLAGIGPGGLDGSSGWGASYWGGALFCFLADVRIRERTGNRRSLDDALRGILEAGGNIGAEWPLGKAFAAGDAAVGVPVLAELYAEMGSRRAAVDLPDLWKKLGVASDGRQIVYDDAAPLSAVRRGITSGK
jgi:hypothetical protein